MEFRSRDRRRVFSRQTFGFEGENEANCGALIYMGIRDGILGEVFIKLTSSKNYIREVCSIRVQFQIHICSKSSDDTLLPSNSL